MKFNKSEYTVKETDNILRPELVLDIPASYEIVVTVRDVPDSATGELCIV